MGFSIKKKLILITFLIFIITFAACAHRKPDIEKQAKIIVDQLHQERPWTADFELAVKEHNLGFLKKHTLYSVFDTKRKYYITFRAIVDEEGDTHLFMAPHSDFGKIKKEDFPQYFRSQKELNRIGFAAVMAGEDTKVTEKNIRQYLEMVTFVYWGTDNGMQRQVMDFDETKANFHDLICDVELPSHFKGKSRPIMVPNEDETIDVEFYTFCSLAWLVKWNMTIKENGEILEFNLTQLLAPDA